MCKALGSIPSTKKQNKTKQKNLKLTIKLKGKVATILKGKSKVGGLIVSDFKTI
jgi:hypothetical protein